MSDEFRISQVLSDPGGMVKSGSPQADRRRHVTFSMAALRLTMPPDLRHSR